MLPNMAQAVLSFSQNIEVQKLTQTMSRGRPTNTYTPASAKGVISTPKAEELKKLDVDVSLKYITIHTTAGNLENGDRVAYRTKKFKVINVQDYSDYGYMKLLCQEDRND